MLSFIRVQRSQLHCLLQHLYSCDVLEFPPLLYITLTVLVHSVHFRRTINFISNRLILDYPSNVYKLSLFTYVFLFYYTWKPSVL